MLTIESDTSQGARLVTDVPYAVGQLIHRVNDYETAPHPTRYSVQTGLQTHIDELSKIAYFNHSCDPNTVFDTSELVIRALRDVAAGDELTFFYPSTEWEMATPFVCRCGAPQCIRVVAGARFLSADVLSRYFINRHVRDLLLQSVEAHAEHAAGTDPSPAR